MHFYTCCPRDVLTMDLCMNGILKIINSYIYIYISSTVLLSQKYYVRGDIIFAINRERIYKNTIKNDLLTYIMEQSPS